MVLLPGGLGVTRDMAGKIGSEERAVLGRR